MSEPFRKGTSFDKLAPFLDDENFIRVGGRLEKSKLPFGQKHSIVLPHNHHVTELLICRTHPSNLYAGIQTTLYAIRWKFYILNGKDQVRKVARRCIECVRQKPPNAHAHMRDLPAARVDESSAFEHTGVDFFDPMLIKDKEYRNKTISKVYGCVFICVVSKAVHIELVPTLSTEGFLIAFRRFVRGIHSSMYSDNGTNFVCANRELQEIYDLFEKPEVRKELADHVIKAKRVE